MTARQLVLWGRPPAFWDVERRVIKLTAGTLAHCRAEAAWRAHGNWSELVAAPFRSHPDAVATCGTCGRSWDAEHHGTPAMLCPFCNGDERAARPWRCYVLSDRPTSVPEPARGAR